jgi:protein ImuB
VDAQAGAIGAGEFPVICEIPIGAITPMFACIYIPDFPVEAIVRSDPFLREHPVAVLDGKPPLVRVIALNEKARTMGMEAGMTKLQATMFAAEESVSEAKTLTQTLEGKGQIAFQQERIKAAKHIAILRQRSPEQEKSVHSALLDIAFGFSPRVEDTAQDRLLLDLAGLERLHGSSANMARELAKQVSAAGLESNIAIAANPDSAMHAACGFNGITIILPGEEAQRLGVLPLKVLLDSFDLPRSAETSLTAVREREQLCTQMLDTLERWGVRDFRTLALLPEHALASRLGEAGARLQRLARGAELRTLTLCELGSCFEEALELESPVETLAPLSFVLNRLLEQLCERLHRRALAAQEITLRLQLERRVAEEETTTSEELWNCDSHVVAQGAWFERRLRLPVSMRDTKVFLKLLQLDLAAHPPGAPVTKLWISAEPAPPRFAQRGLFLELTPEAERLEITLARIAAIVGEHRAGIAHVRDTHRADAFAMERFTAEEQSHTASYPTLSEAAGTVALVLRICRPARPLKVRTTEGRPVIVYSHAAADQMPLEGEVLWSAGPWRSTGEWWAEPSETREQEAGPWDREEWDIALANKADSSVSLYRIYRDNDSGKWFAYASYD